MAAGPWDITEVEQEGRTLIVRHTNSSRLRRGVGRDRRSGRLWDIEDTFPSTPRFERYGGKDGSPRPTSASSAPGERGAVIRKGAVQNFREVEARGRTTWMKSKPGAAQSGAQTAGGAGSPEAQRAAEEALAGGRGTFTSLLRAAIASAQRAAAEAHSWDQQQMMQEPGSPGGLRSTHGGDAKERHGPHRGASSPPEAAPFQKFVTLDGKQLGRAPRRGGMPVAWANRQFYDSGLGLGPRFPSFETPQPGPGAYRKEIQNDTGSVALWNEDAISLPSKQPLACHKSTIANRFGCRRGDEKLEKERAAAPGPGYYKHHTFVDEMIAKRKPKKRTLQLHNSWCSIP